MDSPTTGGEGSGSSRGEAMAQVVKRLAEDIAPPAFWEGAEWAGATRPPLCAGDLRELAVANSCNPLAASGGGATVRSHPFFPLRLAPGRDSLAQAVLARRPRDPG